MNKPSADPKWYVVATHMIHGTDVLGPFPRSQAEEIAEEIEAGTGGEAMVTDDGAVVETLTAY
jgi:hypothetical protein